MQNTAIHSEHERPWRPISPDQIYEIFAPADFPWWIAGGHAIEHAAGRPLRRHADIDVLLLKSDLLLARSLLAGWDCWAADPPGTLRPWHEGEVLPPQVSDIWCRKDQGDSWRFQLMADDGSGGIWQSRRCPKVTKPVAELGKFSEAGIPFLVPEVQLFYKAKNPRPKDELDFRATLPALSNAQRGWLRNAIDSAYGAGNKWSRELH